MINLTQAIIGLGDTSVLLPFALLLEARWLNLPELITVEKEKYNSEWNGKKGNTTDDQ